VRSKLGFSLYNVRISIKQRNMNSTRIFTSTFVLIAVCLLALIVELLNSAVEAAIDRISLERHPLSKNAKDMGSAAQFVALSMIALVWAVILL